MKTGFSVATIRFWLLLVCALILLPSWLTGQGVNMHYMHEISDIERRLLHDDFAIVRFSDLRFEGDVGKRVVLRFNDNVPMQLKWRRALKDGDTFNNRPRYEVAAYHIQKLFLDEADYVVPPTLVRGFSHKAYKQYEKNISPTFRKPDWVMVMMQYWLENVTTSGIWDEDRYAADSVYARNFEHCNMLTYLIGHADSNKGNLLASSSGPGQRIFAVDNGIAFDSEMSKIGFAWRHLRVKKLPRATTDRLLAITEDTLKSTLETVAQFEIRDGKPVPVAPTKNLRPHLGVRSKGNIWQIGLTRVELRDLWWRLDKIKEDIEKGKIAVY